MRILMLSHGYPPTISGVTLVVQKISRALTKKGHQVAVVTASERGEAYTSQDEGVHLLRVRSLSNPFWTEGPVPFPSLDCLNGIIRDFRPDVIHTHENVILSNELLRVRDGKRIPLVSSCYFLPRYVTHYVHWRQEIDNLIERATTKYAVSNLNQFDHVIFSTETQKKFFVEHGLSTRSTAISNGVDNLRYHPRDGKEEEVERRYRLPPRPRILCVGRLMKDKKIDLLIQAMARVVAEQEAHLLVSGRGAERPELEKLIKKLDLQKYVHLLGFVPEEDLPAIYRASDLFTIVSVCEVQSIPTLQAEVTGLPVVAVNAGALPELVQSGVNGHLVPPDDPQAIGLAILDILRDSERAHLMGQASLKIGAIHTNSATFQAYETFYQSMIRQERE